MMLPKIIETKVNKDSKEALVELYLNEDLIWFKGHFNGFAILPAICQIMMVKHFAHELLGLNVQVDKITRIKFLNIAHPHDTIFLSLSIDQNRKSLAFNYFDKDNNSFSKGTLKLCQI